MNASGLSDLTGSPPMVASCANGGTLSKYSMQAASSPLTHQISAQSVPLTPTTSSSAWSNSTDDAATEIVSYPAPIPQFSIPIRDVLRKGDKRQLMLLYSEFISEAAVFYLQYLPSDTGKAKVSYENIGRSLVEAFPVLAVTDSKTSWTYLNGKLSSAVRNSRCRMKRKLSSSPCLPTVVQQTKKAKMACIVSVAKEKLGEDEYIEKTAVLKKELLKSSPDMEHVKLLLEATYLNRREWIKNTSSNDLRLKEVLQQFPAFNNNEFLLNELWLQLSQNCLEAFTGQFLGHFNSNLFYKFALCVLLY